MQFSIPAGTIARVLTAAFQGTDVAEEVADAEVTSDSTGYTVTGVRRETAFRIARHVLLEFASDPAAGDVTVQVTLGRSVRVTVGEQQDPATAMLPNLPNLRPTATALHSDREVALIGPDELRALNLWDAATKWQEERA